MQRREPSVRPTYRRLALATLALIPILLAGCVTPNGEGVPSAQSDFTEHIREVDLTPRPVSRVKTNEISSKSRPSAEEYYGDGSPAAAVQRPSTAGPRTSGVNVEADPTSTGSLSEGAQGKAEKGYEINFENTPIATVAKAILGDILGAGYTIDPRVQGTVSLSSGRAVPRKDLLFVLENALRMSGVALVHGAEGYRLIPTAEAVASRVGRLGARSFSWIRNQRHPVAVCVGADADQAARQLRRQAGHGARGAVAQPDYHPRKQCRSPRRHPDGVEFRCRLDDRSIGRHLSGKQQHARADYCELNRIIDAGQGGLSQDLVKLEPIGRQNAILVVTRKPELLKRVATWITRLDKSGGAGTDVKVYRMRYGDARQVAELLNDMFVGSGGSDLDSPANQLSPGSGAMASSSTPANTRNVQQSSTTPASTSAPGQAQQASTSQPSNFDSRFNGQRVAGPAMWAGGNATSTSPAPGAAAPILPNVRITADAVNNNLLIYANQESYNIITRALAQIDRPQLQVAIDATIAEVTLNDQLQYGVQFFIKSTNLGAPPNTGSIVNTAAKAVLNRVLPGFNFLMGTEAEPQLIINALHSVTDVKILSNPSLVVVDNQFATLQVGDQIPVTTQSAQSVIAPGAPVVNNIDYRNTGVILRVAPRINANGNVLLNIEQEISAVADNGNQTTLTPTVSQRRVASSIAVASGQTVLLAGLVSETQNRGRNGIPGLDRIPGIGEVFSQNSGKAQRTELIIFIRPQIIRNGVDAYHVAAELRDKILRSRHGVSPPPAISPRP